jgi:cytidylate kinase
MTTGKSNMKIWVVMAKVEELQARVVERVFDSIEKAKQYSEDQYKKEIRHFVNIGGIDRSIEEWEVE